jgi:hypothetical protein
LSKWRHERENKCRTISISPTGCERFSAPPHVKEQTTENHHRTVSGSVKLNNDFLAREPVTSADLAGFLLYDLHSERTVTVFTLKECGNLFLLAYPGHQSKKGSHRGWSEAILIPVSTSRSGSPA